MDRCMECGGQAVYKYLGKVYCADHFTSYFERKTLDTISKYNLFRSGEHVIVAVSGGKDSLSLLYILNKYGDSLGIRVTALLIDEGIKGYRDITIKDFKEINRKINAEYRIITYKDVFGLTLDEILEVSKEKGLPTYACSYCGVFRRYLLNLGARWIGGDVLATAHNLDDIIQTYLLNIFTNSIERILHLHPRTESASHIKFIHRVKPFYEVLEMETTLYAMLNGLYPRFLECPYAPDAFRNDIRSFINQLEEENPGIKYKILESLLTTLERYGAKKPPKINSCKICGEPTSQEICRTCRYLDDLGLLNNLTSWIKEAGQL